MEFPNKQKNLKKINDSNQNEASMSNEQPKPPNLSSQFLYSDDETFEHINENMSDFNSNPLTRIENDSDITGTAEEITDNINNFFTQYSEDSEPSSYSKYSSNYINKNHSHLQSFNYGNQSNCNRRQKQESNDIISIIFVLMNFIIDFLVTTFTQYRRNLSKWVLDCMKLDTSNSEIIKIPLKLIEQIFAWCPINICRQNKTNGLVRFPSVRNKNLNWEVATKLVRLGLYIVIILMIIIFLNNYISKNESTSTGEYCSAIELMKKIYYGLIIDLKNTVGVECIRKNNCCLTKMSFIMRWIKCFLQQPFYVAMISETRQITRRKLTTEDYNNIFDWKLKRQMKKISSIQKDLKTKNDALIKKEKSHVKMVEELKKIINRNLSNINNLAVQYDAANDYLDEMIKNLENLKSNIMEVETIKQNIVKNYHEIESCFKCTIKSTLTEIESIDKTSKKTFDEHQEKINELKSQFDENLRNDLFEKRIEIFKAEVLLINDKAISYQMSLTNFEDHLYQSNNYFNDLRKSIFGRLENYMMELSQNNKKLANQFQKTLKLIGSKLKISPDLYENLYRHLIVETFHKYYDFIKQTQLKMFCKILENHIKFTIKNVLAMNIINIKKCSIIYINDNDVHFASPINLDNINKVTPLPCCIDKESLLLKISQKLNVIIGYFDYALASNGAKIVEDSASSSFRFYTNFNNAKSLILSNMVYNRCWLLKNLPAHVTIQLSSETKVSHISIGHISKELTFENSINDAPKDFKVYGLFNIADTDRKLLGDFTFNNNGQIIQTFKIKTTYIIKYIQLKIISNHGARNQTCVYKFKVYGDAVSK